jgi:hypothetical protein
MHCLMLTLGEHPLLLDIDEYITGMVQAWVGHFVTSLKRK